MPIPMETLLPTALVVLGYAVVLWLLSLALRDASIMDIAWGPGFVLVAVTALVLHPGTGPRPWLVLGLSAAWASRLAWHIFRRNRRLGEDRRYAGWRADAGQSWWWRSLFKVFLLQGVIMWFVAMTLVAAVTAAEPAGLTAWDFAGMGLWVFGFLFEMVADRQLEQFRSETRNRGRVMDRGLWRYSRHPNYFGETVLWWGFGLVACAVPYGFVTLLGPAVMTWLIVRVSGVTMLERILTKSRPGYAAYVRRTPAFIPWIPPKED